MAEPRGAHPPLPLVLGFAAFLLVIAYLVATSLLRPKVAQFAPTPAGMAPSGGPGPDTVTVDARDESRWQYYSLSRGLLVAPDTAGWDLGFRRFHVIASGPVADAGAVAFGQPVEVPAGGFAPTAFARDTLNPALEHWYRYGFVTHLLRPNGHVFVLQTRAGGRAKLEFLSYYCPGVEAGCLTFRWVFQP